MEITLWRARRIIVGDRNSLNSLQLKRITKIQIIKTKNTTNHKKELIYPLMHMVNGSDQNFDFEVKDSDIDPN